MNRIDRRSFLKGSVLAGVGAMGAVGLSACAPQVAGSKGEGEPLASTSGADVAWDREADVVIVGGGGTGWAAAYEATKAGCEVLVLEKNTMMGGNTAMSGGMIQGAGTRLQKENGIEDSVERFTDEQIALGMGMVDEDVVRSICEQSPEIIELMEELGQVYTTLDSVSSFKPYSNDDNWAFRVHWIYEHDGETVGGGGLGVRHVDAFRVPAEEAGCVGETNTEVVKLIKDAERGIVGVVAKKGTDTFNVKARKGVVLAAAGIDGNKEMAKSLNKMQYWALRQVEAGHGNLLIAQTNTGDGIRMGMEVGADLNMSEACIMIPKINPAGVHDYYQYVNPEAVRNRYSTSPSDAMIFVNRFGNRFMQEDAMWGYCMGKIYQEVRDTGRIFDEEGNTGIFAVTDAAHAEEWLTEERFGEGTTLDQLLESGAIIKADTLQELAAIMDVPAATLERTVQRWNEISDAGEDFDFGRDTGFARIETAPFYASQIDGMAALGTAGGLKINANCEVIDVNGNVIPRLYAGGQNAGGWMGQYYHSCGWAVLGTAALGRTAGIQVAALDSWDI